MPWNHGRLWCPCARRGQTRDRLGFWALERVHARRFYEDSTHASPETRAMSRYRSFCIPVSIRARYIRCPVEGKRFSISPTHHGLPTESRPTDRTQLRDLRLSSERHFLGLIQALQTNVTRVDAAMSQHRRQVENGCSWQRTCLMPRERFSTQAKAIKSRRHARKRFEARKPYTKPQGRKEDARMTGGCPYSFSPSAS